MYRIINQSPRTFIVKAEGVLKGGKKHPIKGELEIPPSPSIVEVTDKLGKTLKTYSGILVVEAIEEPKQVEETSEEVEETETEEESESPKKKTVKRK